MPREPIIKNVWRDNLDEEMANIRKFVRQGYTYVSIDTEFPGIVARPIGTFKSQPVYTYQQLRCNVDILKIIQLGISICDKAGNRPEPIHVWQFNFFFDLSKDMYSQSSIELLLAAKLDFKEHVERGIAPERFGCLLYTSGLVLSRDVVWISFHSAYDFGYLIKILTGNPMAKREEEFYLSMNVFFPTFYDLKYMVQNTEYCRKGLQEIANDLGISRDGIAHQAGSDALLTSHVFFRSFTAIVDKNLAGSMVSKLYGIERPM